MPGQGDVWSVNFQANALEWERAKIAASNLTPKGRRQTDLSIALYYGAIVAAAAVAMLLGKWALQALDLSAVTGISSTVVLLGLAFAAAWFFQSWMNRKMERMADQTSSQELLIGPDFVVAHTDDGKQKRETIVAVAGEQDMLTILLPRQRLVYVPARALPSDEFETLRDFLQPMIGRTPDQ